MVGCHAAGRHHHLATICAHRIHLLLGRLLVGDDDVVVPAQRARHRDGGARVSRGGRHHRHAGAEVAARNGLRDDMLRNAVLNGTRGIEILTLSHNFDSGIEAVCAQVQQGGTADELLRADGGVANLVAGPRLCTLRVGLVEQLQLAGVLVHRVRERLFGDGRRRDGPRWSRARGGGGRSDATGRHAADARQHSRAQDDASTSPNTRAAGASPGLRAHRRRMVGRDARSERLHHFRTKKLLCFISGSLGQQLRRRSGGG
mmetsp:Transcript_21615/g.34995  ORF Transcript_21615/g.34995 Transcript_21615/m.34995 type:complete len:259 (-) Transcript_21615:58-834(-)